MFRTLFSLPAHSTPPRRRMRPCLECLESRDTPSTTVLTVAPNPATFGQSVTLTATVTEGPGDTAQPGTGFAPDRGMVEFMDGSASLGIVAVTPGPGATEGTALLTTAGLGVGTHALSAVYSGDFSIITEQKTINSTSNAVAEVINPAPPAPPAPSLLDVSGSVTLTPVKPKRHHPANPLSRHFTLRDTGGTTVQGPLFVVVRDLGPRVHLKNAAGVTQTRGHPGDPFVRLDVSLAAGQSMDVLLAFSNPKHKHFSFTTEVFAGTGTL
jgi:hypothetical protein